MTWFLIILAVGGGFYLAVALSMLVQALVIGFALQIPLTVVLRETLGECLFWPWELFR